MAITTGGRSRPAGRPAGKAIRWGVDGDFERCIVAVHAKVAEHGKPRLGDHVIKGLCSTLHVEATGARPGHAPAKTTCRGPRATVPADCPRLAGHPSSGNVNLTRPRGDGAVASAPCRACRKRNSSSNSIPAPLPRPIPARRPTHGPRTANPRPGIDRQGHSRQVRTVVRHADGNMAPGCPWVGAQQRPPGCAAAVVDACNGVLLAGASPTAGVSRECGAVHTSLRHTLRSRWSAVFVLADPQGELTGRSARGG